MFIDCLACTIISVLRQERGRPRPHGWSVDSLIKWLVLGLPAHWLSCFMPTCGRGRPRFSWCPANYPDRFFQAFYMDLLFLAQQGLQVLAKEMDALLALKAVGAWASC